MNQIKNLLNLIEQYSPQFYLLWMVLVFLVLLRVKPNPKVEKIVLSGMFLFGVTTISLQYFSIASFLTNLTFLYVVVRLFKQYLIDKS
jgi:hypothetical protein